MTRIPYPLALALKTYPPVKPAYVSGASLTLDRLVIGIRRLSTDDVSGPLFVTLSNVLIRASFFDNLPGNIRAVFHNKC